MPDSPKVFVLGLDGGDWKVFDHMIDRGVMPNLKKLREKGAWGPLNSTIPPITCPAWLCYGTGKNPGKIGIYYFTIRETEGYGNIPFYYRRDVKGENFWDILSDNGINVGLVNIPTVWKPYKINGFIIAGFMTNFEETNIQGKDVHEKHSGLMHPPELHEEIADKVGRYYVGFPKAQSTDTSMYSVKELVDDMVMVSKTRVKTILHLVNNADWQMITVDIFSTDRIGHLYYQITAPDGLQYGTLEEKESRKHIERYYKEIDKLIGKVRKAVGEDTYFFIMSDHGMGNQVGTFKINDWLLKHGYLKLKQAPPKKKTFKDKILETKGKAISKAAKTAREMNLTPVIEKVTRKMPSNVRKQLPISVRRLDPKEIDWKKTQVFYQNLGLYINTKGRDPQGYVSKKDAAKLAKKVRKELRETVKEFDPEMDVTYHDPKEEYSGQYKDEAPDIIFSIGDYLYFPDARVGYSQYFVTEFGTGGFHRQHGVFVASHPDVKPGKVKDMNLIDLCPTILHVFGVNIPKDVDGKVMHEVFTDSSEFNTRPVLKGGSSEMRKLKGSVSKLKLGKIGKKL